MSRGEAAPSARLAGPLPPPDLAAPPKGSRWLWPLAVASGILWLCLTLLSHGRPLAPGPGFHYPVDNRQMPTEAYLVIHTLLWLLACGTWICLRAHPGRNPIRFIVVTAVVFRLLAVPGIPIHENDYYRFLWDGSVAKAGVNPYRFEPGALRLLEDGIEEPFADPVTGVSWRGRSFDDEERALLSKLQSLRERDPESFSRIGHPAVRTIYPPLAQGLFFLAGLPAGASLISLKVLLLLCDLAVLAAILSLLRRLGLPPAGALLYAWSPLVIKEFANSSHYDALPILLSLVAIRLCLDGAKLRGAMALAGGVLAKYFSVLLLPVLFPFQRASFRPLALFALAIVAAFVPFLLWNGAGLTAPFSGLRDYGEHWHYNPGAFFLLYLICGDLTGAKIISASLVGALGLGFALKPATDARALVRRCGWMVGAALVLSPTVFPWYGTWIVPFICLFPRFAWILLTGLLPFAYLGFQPDSTLGQLEWLGLPAVSWFLWLLFAAFALAGVVSRKSDTCPGADPASS